MPASATILLLSCVGVRGSALHRAAEAGDATALEEALARGEDTQGRDKDNYTPLHLAAGVPCCAEALNRRNPARRTHWPPTTGVRYGACLDCAHLDQAWRVASGR